MIDMTTNPQTGAPDDNKGLDAWLRHTADTMRKAASVMPNYMDLDKLRIYGWSQEIECAADEVATHNKNVLAQCAYHKECAGRTRLCPTCPKEFFITWPHGPVPKSENE